MEEVHFYYSAGGRDVYGPVTKAMLHDLLRDNIIDSNYFFCREGETEWRQVDPAVIDAEPEVYLPDPEETPATEVEMVAEAPPSALSERLDAFWSSWVEIMESTSIRLFLRGICIIVPILVGFILTSHYARTLPVNASDPTDNHLVPLSSRFAIILAAVALIVYLVGLPFPTAYRLWIRTSSMLFLGALVASGLIH